MKVFIRFFCISPRPHRQMHSEKVRFLTQSPAVFPKNKQQKRYETENKENITKVETAAVILVPTTTPNSQQRRRTVDSKLASRFYILPRSDTSANLHVSM